MPPRPKNATAIIADNYLRRVVAGHSAAHAAWTDAKRKASKQVNVRQFDKNLGRSLDALRDTCMNAGEILKIHGALDARTLTPVKNRANKVYDIIKDYWEQIKDGSNGATGQERSAWITLKAGLGIVDTEVAKLLKPLTEQGLSGIKRPAMSSLR